MVLQVKHMLRKANKRYGTIIYVKGKCLLFNILSKYNFVPSYLCFVKSHVNKTQKCFLDTITILNNGHNCNIFSLNSGHIIVIFLGHNCNILSLKNGHNCNIFSLKNGHRLIVIFLFEKWASLLYFLFEQWA